MTDAVHEHPVVADVASAAAKPQTAAHCGRSRSTSRDKKEPGMAPKPERTKIVGYLPHDALVRVDERVKAILARQAALERARRAAERLKRP